MATPNIATEQRRKRLSIGAIDLPEGFVQDDRPENPRGMLNFLKNDITSTLDAAEEAGKKPTSTSAMKSAVLSLWTRSAPVCQNARR